VADSKITELPNISGATLVDEDEFVVVDISADATYAITHAELFSSVSGISLGAVDTTITATAVDVFVYDTSKDSDGGAYRKRMQNRSWYNETLNTATRGATRDIPSVPVVLAKASEVTIYNGDDPSLPMWRVEDYTGLTITSVDMVNGKLVIGTTTGVVISDYAADNLGSTTLDYTTATTPAIVNNAVNDVTITVEAGAPIDAATGLAVPTIAVATGGGLSVINNDGTVTDSSATGTVINVAAAENGFWYSEFSGSRLYYTTFADALAGDGFGDKFGDTDGTADFNSVTTAENMDYNSGILSAGGSPLLGDFELSVNGLMLHEPNYTTQAEGMSALITDEFNTGWMQGDIKGAFLSSTDTASLVGGDLVTNGDNEAEVVSNDASNMTKVQSSDFAQSGSFSAKYTAIGGNTFHYAFNQAVAADEYVRLRYWVYIPLAYAGAGVGHVDVFDGSFLSALENTRDTWVFVEDFREPKGTEWQVAIGNPASESIDGAVFYLDNISVETGVDLDRSVNSNSLQVNGTITRTAVATGAELVGYSGWSAANYLEQPYNADLDFGTGAFCVMGWITEAANTGIETILERDSATTAQRFTLALDTSGNMDFTVDDNTTVRTASGARAIDNGTPTHVVAYYDGAGGVYTYINGVADASATGASLLTLNNASAVTRLGVAVDGLEPLTNGSLALWRISATVPSAAQIKKSYEDEKYLFQENADAVLTNSTVEALGFDSDTNLLHVGGDVGKDEFQGLRRVGTTAGAVTAAVSASNKLTATGKATTVDVDQPVINLRETLNALRRLV